MTSTGRINYIDELKGFILCLVCLGHIAYSELSYVMNWMSLMRMFTFFFLSGLLFSRRRFPTFKDYAISKTKHLLFPYIWLSLFFLIITFPIYAGHIDEASRGPLFIKIENTLNLVGITSNFICSLCANFFKIFILGNSSIWATPLWFVFTLWTVSLLYAFIDERFKNKIPLILISIICIGAIEWVLRNNHNIPYNLGASCTAYVYYAFGSIYKRKAKDFIDKYLHFFPKLKKEVFSPKRESMKEFFLLQRTLGKGESACMIYCRDNRDVLGSSNLKDIKEYCSKNNITYLTTLDFLYYAYCRKKMTEQECKEFMQEVNNAGSKLPIIDITQYTCTVQI